MDSSLRRFSVPWRWRRAGPCLLVVFPIIVFAGEATVPFQRASQEARAAVAKPAKDSRPGPELRLSLRQAVRLAIENNLQIRLARLDDRMRHRDLLVARAIFDPFFSVDAQFAKNRDPTVSFLDIGTGLTTGINVNPSENRTYSSALSGTWEWGTTYEARLRQRQADRPDASSGGITSINPTTVSEFYLDLRQPLLQGSGTAYNTAEIRIARNNLEVSEEELGRAMNDTVLQVETAYWDVVFAAQSLASSRKALEVATENLDNYRKRQAVGLSSENEVTTARSQVVTRRVEVNNAQLLLEENSDTLLDLINYAKKQSLKTRWQSGESDGPFDNVTVICTTEPAGQVAAPPRDRALALAFRNRPEYRQLALNTENQRIRVEKARNELLPTLDLVGRWTQLGLEEDFTDSYAQVGTGRFYDWFVGAEFSIPLSSRGPRNRYRNARDELRKLEVERQDLENQIVLSVDRAIRKIDFLNRRVIDLNEQVRLQEELVADAKIEVEAGRAIPYAVSIIENDLEESRTQAIRATTSLQIARAELYQATGTALDEYGIRLSDESNEEDR